MKIEKSAIEKITITGVKHLDPVSVVVEDFGPGQGEITITCWGQAWSHYWSHMGETNKLADFFCSCSNDYLAGKLKTGINAEVDDDDEEKLEVSLKAEIMRRRRDGDFSQDTARELWDRCQYVEWNSRGDICFDVFGDEWWHLTPKKPNHEYEYLCRIIDTVKEALMPAPSPKE